MRIYMITGDDLTSFRGGTIHLVEQAENLQALGHDVCIFAQDRGPLPQPTTVSIRYLPAIVHTRQMGYSAMPLLAARLLGVPHVLEVNGILRDELARRGSALRLAVIDWFARVNLAPF
tara:strand:+ start:616 stop:969 length:354 start_codon:yes stop_codon:yes gene_type:complete